MVCVSTRYHNPWVASSSLAPATSLCSQLGPVGHALAEHLFVRRSRNKGPDRTDTISPATPSSIAAGLNRDGYIPVDSFLFQISTIYFHEPSGSCRKTTRYLPSSMSSPSAVAVYLPIS